MNIIFIGLLWFIKQQTIYIFFVHISIFLNNKNIFIIKFNEKKKINNKIISRKII
jgi:hypothetical protein